jgi:hypothetical protein
MPSRVTNPAPLWFFGLNFVFIIILSLFIWLGVIFTNKRTREGHPGPYINGGGTIISVSGAAILFILACFAYFIKVGGDLQQAHDFVGSAVIVGTIAIVIDILTSITVDLMKWN